MLTAMDISGSPYGGVAFGEKEQGMEVMVGRDHRNCRALRSHAIYKRALGVRMAQILTSILETVALVKKCLVRLQERVPR